MQNPGQGGAGSFFGKGMPSNLLGSRRACSRENMNLHELCYATLFVTHIERMRRPPQGLPSTKRHLPKGTYWMEFIYWPEFIAVRICDESLAAQRKPCLTP